MLPIFDGSRSFNPNFNLANLGAMRNLWGGGAPPVRPIGFPQPGPGTGGSESFGGQPPMQPPMQAPMQSPIPPAQPPMSGPYPVGPMPVRGGPMYPPAGIGVENGGALPPFSPGSAFPPSNGTAMPPDGLQNIMALRQMMGY